MVMVMTSGLQILEDIEDLAMAIYSVDILGVCHDDYDDLYHHHHVAGIWSQDLDICGVEGSGRRGVLIFVAGLSMKYEEWGCQRWGNKR